MTPRLSPAAAGLLRALIARGGKHHDTILLGDATSVDWQSCTFAGERHQFRLAVRGPTARKTLSRMLHELADAEFAIPGQMVADIIVASPPNRASDGTLSVAVEALTVTD